MRRCALALALALPGCGCRHDPAPPAPLRLPDGAALVLDGVVIQRAEVDAFLPFLRRLDPTMGRNKCIRLVLGEHLIPLAFARREFAALRTEQRTRAEALAKVLGSGGYDDAVQRTKRHDGAEVQTGVIRQALPLPEQEWLFAEEHVGRVSPVLETPQGFSLVAAADRKSGITSAYDRVDALLVRFFTHKAKPYDAWLRALRQRLGSLAQTAKLVHPDYRDALPPWLTP